MYTHSLRFDIIFTCCSKLWQNKNPISPPKPKHDFMIFGNFPLFHDIQPGSYIHRLNRMMLMLVDARVSRCFEIKRFNTIRMPFSTSLATKYRPFITSSKRKMVHTWSVCTLIRPSGQEGKVIIEPDCTDTISFATKMKYLSKALWFFGHLILLFFEWNGHLHH